MIQRVCGGLLGGYQRVYALAWRAAIRMSNEYAQYTVLRKGIGRTNALRRNLKIDELEIGKEKCTYIICPREKETPPLCKV